jgi:hypothetical protein
MPMKRRYVFFFFFLSVVRSVSSEERDREREKNEEKCRLSLASLMPILRARLYVVEGVSGGHTLFARSLFFSRSSFFPYIFSQHVHTQMILRPTYVITLAFLRLFIFPFPCHHYHCRQAASDYVGKFVAILLAKISFNVFISRETLKFFSSPLSLSLSRSFKRFSKYIERSLVI